MKFYFGAASGSQRKAVKQLEADNVMISYATDRNEPIEDVDNIFYDCGAYSLFAPKPKGRGLSKYPFTAEEYFRFIQDKEPERFALMDYVCEPEVRRIHSWTVERQQRKTLEKHRKLFDLIKEHGVSSQPVTVLQGYKVNHYLEHIDRFREHGMLTDVVGIGTLCSRKDTTQIKDIVNAVREALPSSIDLHGFGVKSDGFQYPSVRKNLDSADSMASSFRARYNRNESDIPLWWRETSEYVRFYDNLMRYFKEKPEPKHPLQSQLQEVQSQ